MNLLNTEALKKLISGIVKQSVQDELAKNGNAINQKMFNRKSAAKYLGVSGSYIDQSVRAGYLNPTFPGDGKTKFYLKEDLDRFAESGKDYLKKV